MEKETLDGNILIAEFLELKTCEIHCSDQRTYPFKNCKEKGFFVTPGTLAIRTDDLKYHSSWDCQIPVWSKIALSVKELIPKLPNPETNGRWYFRALSEYEKAIFNNEPIEGQKIIIELIKWYNNNQHN